MLRIFDSGLNIRRKPVPL